MNLSAYLYTINKNNSFKLDPEELKDVQSEISIYLLNKSYNDLLIKKSILFHYLRAVKKKVNSEEFILSENYLTIDEPGAHEIELKRKAQLNKLKLNDKQKKIVSLLISGFSYKEIRKRLKLNDSQLTKHVFRIKQNNLSVV